MAKEGKTQKKFALFLGENERKGKKTLFWEPKK